jgi:hypothetical protein
MKLGFLELPADERRLRAFSPPTPTGSYSIAQGAAQRNPG